MMPSNPFVCFSCSFKMKTHHRKGGRLLMCDFQKLPCPRTYHIECLKFPSTPSGGCVVLEFFPPPLTFHATHNQPSVSLCPGGIARRTFAIAVAGQSWS